MSDARRARMAKVHIAKKALAMHDDSYRALLRRITGKDTSTACSEVELDAVITEFKRLGFADARLYVAPSDKSYVRMIYGVWADLKPYLRDHSKGALRKFVQRQTRSAEMPNGVAAPEFLNAQQGNKVIEGLKAMLARSRAQAVRDSGDAESDLAE